MNCVLHLFNIPFDMDVSLEGYVLQAMSSVGLGMGLLLFWERETGLDRPLHWENAGVADE